MSLGFEYGNTRLRAMKAKLIDHQAMRFLADSNDVDDFLLKLTKMAYKESIEQASAQTSGQKIFTYVTRIHLFDLISRIRSFYDKPISEVIDLFLFRYEIHNIKTILRGVAQRVSTDEIQRTLIPTGLIPLTVLDILADQDSPIGLITQIQFFDLPYAEAFKNYHSKDVEKGLIEYEIELEKWYFRKCEASKFTGRRNFGVFLESIKMEADILNLLSAFRFVGSDENEVSNISTHFITNGSISLEKILMLASSKQFTELVALLNNTPYQKAFASGMELYREYWNISDLEKSLRLYRLKWYADRFKKDPHGIGIPVGYLNLKQNEMRNLLWIYKGIVNNFRLSTILNNLEFA